MLHVLTFDIRPKDLDEDHLEVVRNIEEWYVRDVKTADLLNYSAGEFLSDKHFKHPFVIVMDEKYLDKLDEALSHSWLEYGDNTEDGPSVLFFFDHNYEQIIEYEWIGHWLQIEGNSVFLDDNDVVCVK